MKKIKTAAIILALVLSALVLPACGKSEFGMTENSDRRMVINAENAGKGDFFMVGALEAEEGETIRIASDLSKGSVLVEIIGPSTEQSIEEVPDTTAEPILTANVHDKEEASGTVPAGSYMLKATCTEKATGTVVVEVVP